MGVQRAARAWPVAAVAVAVFAVLAGLSGRYGYHRDEFYFLAAGQHLAWGYADQPPLVPLLAWVMSWLAPGSLVVLRLPSAVAAAADVVVTALIARELGAGRGGQTLAAGVIGLSAIVLGSGHLLSTATYGLSASVVLLWLVVRILRTGAQRLWLVAGAVTGVGLLANGFVLLVVAGLAAGVLLVGPRDVFTSRWLWAGVVVVGALWSPYLVWQAQHGWPEVTIADHIAAGGSGTSEPRWAVVPFQLALTSLWLAPVLLAGLWRLLRDPRVRVQWAVGVGYLVALAVLVATGGKSYYVAGFFAPLAAAGAQPTLAWVGRGRASLRRALLTAAFVLSLPAMLVTLPIVPASALHRTPIVDANYDAGETVGWPAYVAEVARVYHSTPGAAAIVTANYGEAGAIDRYGADLHLPAAHSGHNSYWSWGPPRDDAGAVVAVGLDRAFLSRWFSSVRLATRLDNHLDVDDDEQGEPVFVCRGLRGSWATVWPHFRHLG